MSEYEFKYNYYFLAPFAFVYIFGALIALAFTKPMGINDSKHYLLQIFIWEGLLLSMCIILVPYTRYVKTRENIDMKVEIDKVKTLIHFDVASEFLESTGSFSSNNIFVDYGKSVPINQFSYNLYATIGRGRIQLLLIAFSKEHGELSYTLDKNLYTYIKHHRLLEDNTVFRLFETDTTNFLRLLAKRKTTVRFRKKDIPGIN